MLLLLSISSMLSLVASLNQRGGPVQQGQPGVYTCVQQECSQYACSPTGVQLQCVNAMEEGYDMEYDGTLMQCDGDGSGFPYRSCTCTYDPVNCDSSSASTTTTTTTTSGTSTTSGPTSTSVTSNMAAPTSILSTGWKVGGVLVGFCAAALV